MFVKMDTSIEQNQNLMRPNFFLRCLQNSMKVNKNQKTKKTFDEIFRTCFQKHETAWTIVKSRLYFPKIQIKKLIF